MSEYNNLLEIVKTSFDEGKKLTIKAADIENLSLEEIDGIWSAIRDGSIAYIEKCQEDGVLDAVSADYMADSYRNAKENRSTLYKNVTNTFLSKYRPEKLRLLSELGEEPAPEQINAINLDSGEVELNSQKGTHASKFKEYRPQHITPFTDMQLTFYDLRDNPIHIDIPAIKDVRRAVEKIKLPVVDKKTGKIISHGGKYHQQYQSDIEKLHRRYGDNESLFQEKVVQLRRPYQRLMDIERLTIKRKYYMDTEETQNIFQKDDSYGIEKNEIKDAFNGNINDSKKYNAKNYRDKKMYLHIEGPAGKFTVETQIKITKLNEADFPTHHIYAGNENSEIVNENELLISEQNTKDKGQRFFEENESRYGAKGDKLLARMQIYRRKMEIQRHYKDKIRIHNLQVIDKAFRLEDAKLANGKNYDATCLNPKTGKTESIFMVSADFIMKNFMYRPFKAYDLGKAFNATDEELQSVGLLINSEQVKDFSGRYSRFIMPKYNGKIAEKAQESLLLPENSGMALAYLDVNELGRMKDETSPSQDEQAVLANIDKKALFDNDDDSVHKRLDNQDNNAHNNDIGFSSQQAWILKGNSR